MNKEIKIIDLFNKIAKGKAIPQKIKFREDIYYLDTGQEDYVRKRDNFGLLDQTCMFRYLNDTVEIIEEDNNKIEKLGNDFMIELHQQATSIEPFVYKMAKKLDKLIDKINNME